MHQLLRARQIVDRLFVLPGIERCSAVVGGVASRGSLQISLRKRTVGGNRHTDPVHQAGNSSHAVSAAMLAGVSVLPSKTQSLLVIAGILRADHARRFRLLASFSLWSDACLGQIRARFPDPM